MESNCPSNTWAYSKEIRLAGVQALTLAAFKTAQPPMTVVHALLYKDAIATISRDVLSTPLPVQRKRHKSFITRLRPGKRESLAFLTDMSHNIVAFYVRLKMRDRVLDWSEGLNLIERIQFPQCAGSTSRLLCMTIQCC